jgi:hypothetical protein
MGTANEYSNLSARDRPHVTKAGCRPALTASIDLSCHSFTPRRSLTIGENCMVYEVRARGRLVP